MTIDDRNLESLLIIEKETINGVVPEFIDITDQIDLIEDEEYYGS